MKDKSDRLQPLKLLAGLPFMTCFQSNLHTHHKAKKANNLVAMHLFSEVIAKLTRVLKAAELALIPAKCMLAFILSMHESKRFEEYDP